MEYLRITSLDLGPSTLAAPLRLYLQFLGCFADNDIAGLSEQYSDRFTVDGDYATNMTLTPITTTAKALSRREWLRLVAERPDWKTIQCGNSPGGPAAEAGLKAGDF